MKRKDYICSTIVRNVPMIIANKELLYEFVQTHAQAVKPLNKWVETVKKARWKSHAELKAQFPSADYVKNGRYVFNIGGNNYRVVTVVIFTGGVMNIRFVGTHSEYNKIDCSTI
jgi:mRNA interferase HigB